MRDFVLAVVLLSITTPASAQDGWQEPFGLGVDDDVHALKGDGQGFLYVGGEFRYGQGETLNGIGRWSGAQWTPLGGGVDGEVYAIEVLGDDVFVGGHFSHAWTADGDTVRFTQNLARWDGQEWHQVGGGTLSPEDSVFALATDGSRLFAGGNYSVATLGLGPASNIGAFNGISWSAMGGVPNTVRAIDVSGSRPIIGGDFATTSGGNGTQYVARWSGSNWEPLGLGVSARVSAVHAIGAQIYVAGRFHSAYNADGTELRTGTSPMYIAKFSGDSWSPLADYLDGLPKALDSEGGNLYVGGSFNRTTDRDLAGDPVVESEGIMRWNGSDWEAMGAGVNVQVHAVEAEPGSIWVGGNFSFATNADVGLTEPGEVVANHIARFGANQWHALGYGLNHLVSSVAAHDGQVLLGGTFTKATFGSITQPANRIVSWNPGERTWTPLGKGVKWQHRTADGDVRTMVSDGASLYVGGLFDYAFDTSSDSVLVNHIARWDGSAWHPLGLGFDNSVQALVLLGGELYAGGFFGQVTNADGSTVDARHVARWDGSQWHSVGGGVSSNVYSLATDGSSLYVGGVFEQAGRFPDVVDAVGVARWDGAVWQGLGGGLQEGLGFGSRPHAYAMKVSGDALYVGGDFLRVAQTDGSEIEANHIARWDGSAWSGLSSGISLDRAGGDPDVRAMAIRDDQVYVVGRFDAVGSVPAFSAARWDGTQWHALGGGFNVVADRTASLDAVAVQGDGVYTGGFFFDVEGYPNGFVARWDASGDQSAATSIAPASAETGEPSSAYPNPFVDHLRVEFQAAAGERAILEVFDLLGRRVTTVRVDAEPGTQTVLLSTAGWTPGLYTYVVRSGQKRLGRGALIRSPR